MTHVCVCVCACVCVCVLARWRLFEAGAFLFNEDVLAKLEQNFLDGCPIIPYANCKGAFALAFGARVWWEALCLCNNNAGT